ncbi:MAG TPA: Fe-S cluster assembly protein SufD [Gemmatimonadaceae bacterium]|nr:Fe-S cluster assembly protein SufD [Gemmatimonadaceae bacterium]
MSTPYREQFVALAEREGRGGERPGWLAARRAEAMARFEALGFPTTKNEDWHYTSLASLADAAFEPMASGSSLLTPADVSSYSFDATLPTIVFLNGRYSSALSTMQGLPDGVRVLRLASAVHEEPTLLERYLTRIASIDEHALTALNTAFLHDGVFLHVAPGTQVSAPIHILHFSDRTAAGGVAHLRALMVVEPNAKAMVLEQYVGLGAEAYFNNAVTEVSVGDGATLNHYTLQRESEGAVHIGTIEVRQGRHSHYNAFSFSSGGALARSNVYTMLGGEGCGCTLNGLYMLDGTQHGDHQTRIEHAEPNCFSRELYKGILDGESHGVFNGKVYVHPIAQKTDGKQTNNTLLLSERAKIDTKPQLEIFADDVKCTHGATVGRIDELALYYMKSRGISADTARKLLTYAFAAEALETIEFDALRLGLERLTLERYAGVEAGA